MSRDFARNSLFATLAGLGTALGSFLGIVLVARLLGPIETGLVAYAVWIATLSATLADIGLTQSLARYLPELSADSDEGAVLGIASRLMRIGLALAMAGAAIFLWLGALADPASTFGPTEYWLVGALFTGLLVSALGLATLRGLQRFDQAALLTLAALAVQLVALAFGAFLGGVPGALAGYAAGTIVPILATLPYAARRPRLDPALRRRILRFGLYSWAAALTTSLVWSRLEIYFLQRYQGAEAVAMFTVGFTFSNLASQGPLLLTGGLLPYFAESFGRGSTERMQRAYLTATRLMAFLLFPTCLGLAALIPVLLPLVYGPAYAEAVPVAAILIVGAALGATGAVGSQMIYACERSDFIFLSGLGGAILSVAAGFLIVPHFGMIGAALARGAIHALMVAAGLWFIRRRLHCPVPFGSLARLLVAALLCALAARACIALIPSSILGLALAVPLGAAVYGVAVRALGALPAEDARRLRNLLSGRLPDALQRPMDGLLVLLTPDAARLG